MMCDFCNYESPINEYFKDPLDGVWYQDVATGEWDEYDDDFVHIKNYGCEYCQYCGIKLEEESEIEMLRRQNSELEDVAASIDCQYDSFVNELCQILFEGEDTEIGRKITIDRIKTLACYHGWLDAER